MPRLSRRLLLQSVLASAPLALLAACQPAVTPTPTSALIKPNTKGVPLTPVLAGAEVAVGRNRFALGLIDGSNQLITRGSVLTEFFKVDTSSGTAEKRFESTATFRTVDSPNKGIWTTRADFAEPGSWGVSVTLKPPTGDPVNARIAFDVKPKFSAPGYGDPAIRATSRTLTDVNGDASKLCSQSPPCEMHALSIDQAVGNGKPTVLAFITPAFCTSATCGPQLNAVQTLKNGYGEKANFVHVEVFDYPFAEMKWTGVVKEWGLISEPWVFLIDRQGIVHDRFEGAAPADEMEPSLKTLV